ncbi:hypothetical protein G6F58_013732 [Rhizopus delemar]|nr:hypothetical protein G6F58_013732 [Rhizopus delemar]
MDVVFDDFNSATAYSGPAAIRLLRASLPAVLEPAAAGVPERAGDEPRWPLRRLHRRAAPVRWAAGTADGYQRLPEGAGGVRQVATAS